VKVKIVGPAYKDVAKKYKGKKGIEALLVQKIKAGGSGNWGQVAMAAHPDLKDEDVKAMVKWILAQK
jgi:cytochrome c